MRFAVHHTPWLVLWHRRSPPRCGSVDSIRGSTIFLPPPPQGRRRAGRAALPARRGIVTGIHSGINRGTAHFLPQTMPRRMNIASSAVAITDDGYPMRRYVVRATATRCVQDAISFEFAGAACLIPLLACTIINAIRWSFRRHGY